MSASEGGIEQLEVRDMWPDEARDFTPWLAENLHQLGDVLDLKLELVQKEKAVGPMSLDILAREVDTGDMVAIENQLEWSDSDHLVRLLIYAAGCDAKVVILVAPEFVYEHANTLHWLNQCSKDELSFYGVKVEVVMKPDDSKPRPRFRKVVNPGGWNKDITQPLNPPTPPHILEDRRKHKDFFQPLVNELRWMDFADNPVQCWNHTDRMFRSRVDRDMGYAASFYNGHAWVFFHLRTWDSVERSNRLYDELLAQRDEIERSVGVALKWQWDRSDGNYFSSISVKRDGTIDDSPEKLAATREWMLELLPKFQEVFDPRLAEILSRLSSP